VEAQPTPAALQKLFQQLMAGSEGNVVVANGLSVLARLVLVNRPAFEALLGNAAAAGVSAPTTYTGPAGGGQPAERLLGALAGAPAETWACRA